MDFFPICFLEKYATRQKVPGIINNLLDSPHFTTRPSDGGSIINFQYPRGKNKLNRGPIQNWSDVRSLCALGPYTDTYLQRCLILLNCTLFMEIRNKVNRIKSSFYRPNVVPRHPRSPHKIPKRDFPSSNTMPEDFIKPI